MANRPNVPAAMKKALVEEAGGKCANPGCPTFMTELHHIQEWHVYQTHDEAHMAAICPSCHEQVHRGDFRIEDAEVYAWKKIARPPKPAYAHLYVEPGGTPALLVGRVLMKSKTETGMSYFRASHGTKLGTRIIGPGILQVELALFDYRGSKLLEIGAGNVVQFHGHEDVEIRQRTGSCEVWTPFDERFVPDWMRVEIAKHDPALVVEGRVLLAGFTVVMPSVVKIRGIWPTTDWGGVVISDTEFIPYMRLWLGKPPSRLTADITKTLPTITVASEADLDSVGTSILGGLSLIFQQTLKAGGNLDAIWFADGSYIVTQAKDCSITAYRGPSAPADGSDTAADLFKRYTTVSGKPGHYIYTHADGSKTTVRTAWGTAAGF